MIRLFKLFIVSILLFASSIAFADSYDDFRAQVDAVVAESGKVFNPRQFGSDDDVERVAESFMMLLAKIAASSLDDREKADLSERLTQSIGEQYEAFAEPYTDVVQVPNSSSPWQRALNKAQRFLAGGLRDVSSLLATIIKPFGGRIRGANPIGEDRRRGRQMKKALNKMSAVLKNATDEKFEALKGSGLFAYLDGFIEKLQQAEPNKWGAQTKVMHTFYIVVTFWAMFDAWDPLGFITSFGGLLFTPTEMHIFWSVVFVTPLVSILMNWIRRHNSGGPVRGATQRLIKALKKYNDNATGDAKVTDTGFDAALTSLEGLAGTCQAQFAL